ncbi:BCCT family transporter [Glutamicibacter creatinolyticus]|uniref:BCCT family transporter n=1 Tax=Glutamicibacter creatinolyticus TaxID=162496 RepID=UPI0031D58990
MKPDTNEQQQQGPIGGSTLTGGELRRAETRAETRKVYRRLYAPGSVFFASLALVVALVLWAALAPQQLNGLMSGASNWAAQYIGWGYLLVTLGCIVLLLFLAFSRYGGIRLGKDGDRPEFSNWAWISMILGAVMGIGLISYGAAEPMSHFMVPPHGRAEPGTIDAAVTALQFSYFDWGPNAWALFGVFGLAIAYSTHRRGNSGLVSVMLRPVLGKSMDGWLGKTIDVFTVLATLFGTTTSLGLGASQIAEGFNSLVGIPTDLFVKVVIIAGVTVVFTLSALSGIGKGIKWLSQATMLGAAIIGVFVLASGPTGFITNIYFRSVGQFLGEFPAVALLTPSGSEDLQWMQWWTYFMMAWWLSWGAFVGIFLARISKGRTVREFVAAVMGVPSLVFSVWFSIFGGTSIHQEMVKNTGIGEATLADTNSTFFALLAELPLPAVTSAFTVVMVVLFFITGADSNTYVLGTLTSGGNMYPKRPVLAVWGLLTGVCAIVLLLVGGLQALQQAAILSAVPFTVIVTLLGVSLMKELRCDSRLPQPVNAADDEKDMLREVNSYPGPAGPRSAKRLAEQ